MIEEIEEVFEDGDLVTWKSEELTGDSLLDWLKKEVLRDEFLAVEVIKNEGRRKASLGCDYSVTVEVRFLPEEKPRRYSIPAKFLAHAPDAPKFIPIPWWEKVFYSPTLSRAQQFFARVFP